MSVPTDAEIAHGLALLAEVSEWTGTWVVIPIDDRCKWGAPHDCGRRLTEVTLLLQEEQPTSGSHAHAAGYCEHHTRCIVAAIRRWKELS